jgi:ribosome biogenesis GTPase A
MDLRRQILQGGLEVNKKRQAKGMLPRPVRAAVIGFPNVGKSSLINRILGRKLAKAQNVAGYTRKLTWVRISGKHDGTLEVRTVSCRAVFVLQIYNITAVYIV